MLCYGPPNKLKWQPELGVPNISVPDIQNKPWPTSPPINQQHRIHVSINKGGIVAQPALPSEKSPGDEVEGLGSSLVDAQKLNMHMTNQAVTPPASFDSDTLYNCKIIAQLQGNYQIETMVGSTQIIVILPEVPEQNDQYAIVHRIDSDGKDLEDQYIYEEPFWFTLNSANGNLRGVLRKASNIKHSVKWWDSNDESYTVWRRKGEVKFNIVQVEPKVRRNSISSVRTVSTSPIVASSVDTSMLGGDDSPLFIRPELLQRAPVFLHPYSNGHYCSTTDNMQSNFGNFWFGVPSEKNEEQQEEMFELIKTQCSNNPILFKKVVDWGMENNSELGISEEKTGSLSDGRLWVIAHTVDIAKDEVITGSLDDIKGAYQKAGNTVWQQPNPEACGSSVQHRLYKSQGRWMMEWHGLESDGWQLRAQEQEDGQWVDFKNNKMLIRVHVIPMGSILKRMDKLVLGSKKHLKKSIDFLFTSCNQVRLVKLKGRNLKHHIANLKVKLEKRYALSLGVKITKAAESIAQE